MYVYIVVILFLSSPPLPNTIVPLVELGFYFFLLNEEVLYRVGFSPFLVPRFYSVGFGKLFDSHSYKVFKIADKILLSVEGRTTERKGYTSFDKGKECG